MNDTQFCYEDVFELTDKMRNTEVEPCFGGILPPMLPPPRTPRRRQLIKCHQLERKARRARERENEFIGGLKQARLIRVKCTLAGHEKLKNDMTMQGLSGRMNNA